MKRVALFLLAVSILAFSMRSSAFASDVAIVSCEVISNDASSKKHASQNDFQIIVVSFSSNEDGSLIVKKNVEGSCVKVIARLVNNENYKIKSVSSTENGPAYTLLLKKYENN
ncbi:MAG TPA: hypothetical protein VI727_02560 [Candidatus Brocadiaceae bacterium]|nr:hypothetical protein [Candidatus Brocadiaceae bacterium]